MRCQLALLGIAVLLAACAGGRSNVEPPAPLAPFSPAARIKQVWSVDVGKGESKKFVKLAPAIHEGVLYAVDIDGRVSAFAVEKGARIWSVELDESVSAAVGFGEGLVLIGTKSGSVFALGPQSGELRWKSTVSTEILAGPAAQSDVVVVQTIDGKVFGLSAADGKRLWVQQRTEPPLSLRGTSAPVIKGGVVFTGFANGKLIAINLRTGQPLWERDVARPRGRNEIERLIDVDAPPLVVGSVLFAVSYQGKVVAINSSTGRVLWSRDESSYSGMDADSQNIYLTDAKGNVLALDQRSGSSLWKQDKLHARRLNAPTLVDQYVAVGDLQGYVHWLSLETGAFVARNRVGGGPIRGKAIALGDTLFVQEEGGVLAALRIEPKAKSSR
ncbi:MAG: outer membrane protein assembly factor BamB [Acidiferrobacterales bacterium]